MYLNYILLYLITTIMKHRYQASACALNSSYSSNLYFTILLFVAGDGHCRATDVLMSASLGLLSRVTGNYDNN